MAETSNLWEARISTWNPQSAGQGPGPRPAPGSARYRLRIWFWIRAPTVSANWSRERMRAKFRP